MTVHPQVKALLERVARSPLPPYHTVPAFVARHRSEDMSSHKMTVPAASGDLSLVLSWVE